jgi:hypothetical protein
VNWGDQTKTVRSMAARDTGVSLKEAATAIDRPFNVTSRYICAMLKEGYCVKAGVHGEYRYFVDREAAQAWDTVAQAERAERLKAAKERRAEKDRQRERNKRAKARAEKGLAPYVKPEPKPKKVNLKPRTSGINLSKVDTRKEHLKARIEYPEGYKHTVAPTGYDTRFTFTPPPGWVGSFGTEWKQKRGEW